MYRVSVPRKLKSTAASSEIFISKYSVTMQWEYGEAGMRWKLETEIWNKNVATNHWCSVFTDSWVVCFAFTLVLCFVITYLVWLTSTHVAGNVAILSIVYVQEGRDTRLVAIWPFYLILEQGQYFYFCSLIPRPSLTFSFENLQYVKQIMSSYPGPVLQKRLVL